MATVLDDYELCIAAGRPRVLDVPRPGGYLHRHRFLLAVRTESRSAQAEQIISFRTFSYQAISAKFVYGQGSMARERDAAVVQLSCQRRITRYLIPAVDVPPNVTSYHVTGPYPRPSSSRHLRRFGGWPDRRPVD